MIFIKRITLLIICIVAINSNYVQGNSAHSDYIKLVDQSDLKTLKYDPKYGIECGICLTTLLDFSSCYKTRCQSFITRPHIFHEECISEWIKIGKNTCPSCNCNINIDKDFIDAVKAGELNQVQKLINNGANINIQDDNGESALAIAIFKCYKDIALLLIENGADIYFKNKNGVPILTYAAYQGYLDIVLFLINKGIDVNIKDNSEGTALIIASFKGHLNVVQSLIENGAEVNAMDIHKNTAIKAATFRKHNDITELLITKNANIN